MLGPEIPNASFTSRLGHTPMKLLRATMRNDMIQSNRLLPILCAAITVGIIEAPIGVPLGVTFDAIANAQSTQADRTTCYVLPNSEDSPIPKDLTDVSQPDNFVATPPAFPGDSTAWQNYLRLWNFFQNDTANEPLRRYLGFATNKSRLRGSIRRSNNQDLKFLRGRSAPQWLAWKPGSYQQVESSHFTIYSRSNRQLSTEVARSLEECYWVWTQMFFPLWEAAPQVSGHLASLPEDQSVSDVLERSSKRITIRRRLNVVLFPDKQQYVATLGKDNPGIAQSTGFYSDDRRTTFLIGQPLDLPTLRHELVHQLFSEATRSGLQSATGDESMPGSQRDFWLVEGIAGYFESMSVQANGTATLGGWDSPRLQFARYRVLASGDEMPIDELRRDGRLSAQSRTDLPRWYAHAIARTHQLMDGGSTDSRKWIYQKLAELYKIDAGLELPAGTIPNSQSLQKFLKVDDAVLQSNPPTRPLTQLCLARCNVSAAGIKSLPVSSQLQWLDLSGLPIQSSDVTRLLPRPESLQQLNLEATKVEDQLYEWLSRAKMLREVDLSWTQTGDKVIESLTNARQLSTLWVTGSRVSDASVDTITKMRSLSNVDVQRTRVSESGLSRLQAARPKLIVNPIQLISQ